MPIDWPQLPAIQANDPQADVKKALFQGQVDVCKLERQYELDADKLKQQENTDKGKASWDNEYKLQQAVYNAYLEVAKGQLDRAGSSAEFVQKTAAAIATIYSSILGLSFVVTQGIKAPLPPTGIVPAFFLGLSIVLAAAFRAYISGPDSILEPEGGALLPERQRVRRNTFIQWARTGPFARRYALQAAVISLGVGVCLLPLPYLRAGSGWLVLIPLGMLVTFALPPVINKATR
jgi:hypothetical protein